MTNKAAFQARFAHYERKPGLKVMRLHFEVPLEKGMETISILGEPTPDNDVWVGIALLGGEPNEEKPSERKWRDVPLAEQAGIRCEQEAFMKFLRTTRFVSGAYKNFTAADLVRTYCAVESRSELDADNDAANRWINLDKEFQAWMAAG